MYVLSVITRFPFRSWSGLLLAKGVKAAGTHRQTIGGWRANYGCDEIPVGNLVDVIHPVGILAVFALGGALIQSFLLFSKVSKFRSWIITRG